MISNCQSPTTHLDHTIRAWQQRIMMKDKFVQWAVKFENGELHRHSGWVLSLRKDNGPTGELHRYDSRQLRDKFGVEQVSVGQELLHKVRGRGIVMTEFVGEKPAGKDGMPQASLGGRSPLLRNSSNTFSSMINEPHEPGIPNPATNDTIGKNGDEGALSVDVPMVQAQHPAPPEGSVPCRPMLRNNESSDLAKQLQVLLGIDDAC